MRRPSLSIGSPFYPFRRYLRGNCAERIARAPWAIVLDLGWVLGSVALVELGLLTAIGAGLLALVALAVFVFAALQFVGVRQAARAA